MSSFLDHLVVRHEWPRETVVVWLRYTVIYDVARSSAGAKFELIGRTPCLSIFSLFFVFFLFRWLVITLPSNFVRIWVNYHYGHLTSSLSPGVGNLTLEPPQGWGIWHQAAEGGEFDRLYTTREEKMVSEYCVRDRMADQKWAVETQGRFWM